MHVLSFRCAFLATSICALTSIAAAETITHKVVVPARKVPWTAPVMVPTFDPALGRLSAVELSLRGRCLGTARYENLRSCPQVVQAEFATSATLFLPNGDDVLAPSSSMSFVDVLPGFDQVLDFEGRSGRRHDGVLGRLDADRRLNARSSLAWFENAAQRDKRAVRLGLRVEGSAHSSDETANAWEQSAATALFVTYHYERAP